MRAACGNRAWIVTAMLLLAVGAAHAEGEINLLYGKKNLDGDWDPLEGQTQAGSLVNIGNQWPVAVAIATCLPRGCLRLGVR